MTSLNTLLVLSLVLLIPKESDAFGWSWFWPRRTTTTTTSSSGTTPSSSSNSVPSMYNISIGNRENTNASLDYGTMITNLQINLARFNGSSIRVDATENRLNEVIYAVVDSYRNRSEAMVDSRLAWIDEVLLDIVGYGRQLRRDGNNRWLKEFPEHVRESVRQLNEIVRNCLEREVDVEELIQAVDNRSRNGCLEGRLQKLFELREEARNNLTEFLAGSGDIEDRLETCVNPDFDDALDNVFQEACISSILLEVEMESLKLGYTVSSLTAAVEPALGQAKAGFLECVADLAWYAFDASLSLRQWIDTCSG